MPTSLFLIFIYYQDVINEKLLMQTELSGVFVIDSLFQVYSSYDVLIVSPKTLCSAIFNRVKRN